MPFYVSPEQAMRDKADFARKNIARGRDAVVLQFEGGIIFVADNPSRTLYKISEIYDRIAFAGVGRYNEYENLRLAGVRYADLHGYSFDRRDVTGRALAKWYAQQLGTIFTETPKPYEVEIVVAEVGDTPGGDQMFRVTFDGSVTDETDFVAMGGQAERVAEGLRERFRHELSLDDALQAAVESLARRNGDRQELGVGQLEVALLDRSRPHRKFRRLSGSRLERLLPSVAEEPQGEPSGEGEGNDSR
jgi:proteasome alpha subunit